MEISSASSRPRTQRPGRRQQPQRGRPASARQRCHHLTATKTRKHEIDLYLLGFVISLFRVYAAGEIAVGSTCSPQRSVAKRALERRANALAGELPFLAE